MDQEIKKIDIKDLILKRLKEIIEVTNKLSVKNSEMKDVCDTLVKKLKEPNISIEDRNSIMLELSKITSHMVSRNNEVGINIRILNELYSMLIFEDYTDNIEEKDLEILDFNLKHVKPVFILDKGELNYFDPKIEEMIDKQVEERLKTSVTDEN